MSDKSKKRNRRGSVSPWEKNSSLHSYAGYGDDESVAQLAGQVGLGFLQNSNAFMKRFVLAQVLGAPKSLDILSRAMGKVGDGGQDTGDGAQDTGDGARKAEGKAEVGDGGQDTGDGGQDTGDGAQNVPPGIGSEEE